MIGCYVTEEGQMFDPPLPKPPRPYRHYRKIKAKPPEPEPEPPSPYTKRLDKLLLAAGWRVSDKDLKAKAGMSGPTISKVRRGVQLPNVAFVRWLVRREAMYATELEAVEQGLIMSDTGTRIEFRLQETKRGV